MLKGVRLRVELEREGRWVPIGELTGLPGVAGSGVTGEEALAAVEEIGSLKMESHLEKTRLLVIRTERRS
jgi:predicted RNase H-like HicB family nuclease